MISSQLFAQSFSIQLEADTSKIRIGEQIILNYTYLLPSNEDIQLPNFKDTISKNLEIIELISIDTTFPDGDISKVIYDQKIRITSFDTGFHVIPPVKIYMESDSLVSNPLLIKVGAPELGEKPEMKDIKPPLDVSFSLLEFLSDYWEWFVLGLILIGLFAFYWFYWRNREVEVEIIEPEEPSLPSHEIALQKFNDLKEKDYLKKKKFKAFHVEMSEILREYLENRYEIHAMEQTTGEIMANLEFMGISHEQVNKLRRLLGLSDMVKFAKTEPTVSDSELGLKHCVEFVEATKIANTKDSTEEEKEGDGI